jgi:PAS domain S-box-containing protein
MGKAVKKSRRSPALMPPGAKELKQLVAALEQSNARFKDIVENALEWIWEVDAKGKYTYASPIVEEILGYKPEEVLKKHFYDLFYPDDREKLKQMAFAVFAKKQSFRQFINRNVHKNGKTVWLSTSGVPILDGEGNLLGYRGADVDITERKQAEEALVDEATRRRILIDQSRDGIVILDQNGKVYEANQRFAEMLGYSPEEVAQLHVWDWDTQWTREQLLEMFQAVGEAGDYTETRHRRKDGTVFDVEISTNGAVYGDQKLAFCVCRDITGRKQAEEELKLRAQILDGATDSIFLNDLDGNIIYVNEAACKAHGYSREELTNMNVRQLLKPEQSQNFNPADADSQKMLEKGEAVFESAHLRKDGSVMPVEIHGRIIESGGRKLSISVIRDITRRKRAEEELRLRAQILDGATDSIFVHNSEGNFIYVNEAACKAHGYSREELMKMKLQQVIAPDRVSHLDADFQEMREKGEAVFESTHLRKDGSIMPSEVHGRTIESGERKLFLTVIRDITERKRAEEERRELEQRSHLTSRLASIGEMAAGIAHEINNPLTAVIGFSQLLMDTNIPDDIKKDIAIIYKEARRAAEVAKNLLVFARKREPVRQPTAINSAIQEVLKLRAYEQKVNNIQVNTRFAAKLPEVMADYSQLQQVFLNIIINAEAAMLEAHNGGALTITTQQVNGIVKVSFADNGPGIAKENLERVFDPFFTTKEVGKGTGLGLSLCHGIVVQHGGRIYAKSKLGKGATFVVELPTNAN